MKHLISYKLFEDTRTRTPSTPAGTTPKIDINNLVTGKDIKDPAKKGKLDNYMSNWFEKLCGDLINDPAGWRDKYKRNLPGYDLKTAGGKTQHMSTDAGFSDIVAGGVALTKGVLKKMFGGPETEPLDPNNPEITPQHERIFVDKFRGEYKGYKTQDQMNDWVKNKYKEFGVQPGENAAIDRSLQATNLDWIRGNGAATSIEAGAGAEAGAEAGAGIGAEILGAAETLAPLGL